MMTLPAVVTIIRLPGDPERYAVSVGHGVYVVDAARGQCSCPDFQYRHAGEAGARCKHGRALLDHLAHERACPICAGAGVLVPRFAYAGRDGRPDTTSLPCVACDGTGMRELAQVDSIPALPSSGDAELRDLFR